MISSYSPTNVSNENLDFNPSLAELIEEILKHIACISESAMEKSNENG